MPSLGPLIFPLALVLEPTMGGWPWTSLASRAGATLQVLGLANHLEDPGVRATLGWAMERERLEAVVIGKEGAGPPWEDAQVSLARLAQAMSGLLALAAPGTRPPAVNALWFDTVSRRFHLFGRDPHSGALREEAASEALRALAASVARELRG
jgi:hypothetical protein